MWHGCGSVASERTAALRYAQDMAAKGTSVKELIEGENDGDDEMFWMVVGDADSYAKAHYWRWRSDMAPCEPRCWLVDVANSEAPVSVAHHILLLRPEYRSLLGPFGSDRVCRDCATRIGVYH